MAMLTKQHFELIANILRTQYHDCPREQEDGVRRVINAFADTLPTTNPYFSREKFVAACFGIRPDNKKNGAS